MRSVFFYGSPGTIRITTKELYYEMFVYYMGLEHHTNRSVDLRGTMDKYLV